MTTATPTRSNPEADAGRRLGWRAAAMAGLALVAGLWVTSRLDRKTAPTFHGRLQARMVTIASERLARLDAVHVKPGERVSAGMPLLVLESEQRGADLLLRKQEAALREQEAIRVKAAADLELHWRRRELQAEIFQTQLKLSGLRQEKLHLDVEQVAWREHLSVQSVFGKDYPQSSFFRLISETTETVPEQRLLAMLQEDAAASAAEALATQIALCEQRLEDLRSLDQKLENQIRMSHGVDAAEEQRNLAAELLAKEEESQSSITVISPGYGLIGVFHKQPGEVVRPGDVLVQILDDDRRTIEVEVPSWAVVNFTPGRQLKLEFPGSEYRTGVISSIPPQTALAALDTTVDAPVKLVLEPAGKLWPAVPVGSRVLVHQP